MEQSLLAKASGRDPGPRNSFATVADLDKYKRVSLGY